MPRANPRKALAALMPLPVEAHDVSSCAVKPLTLGMWAALERIDSPLITGEEPKDALELIPSLYLLTHDPREVFKGNILDLAMQWADTVPVSTLSAIRAACERQLKTVSDVIPELDEEERAKRKKATGRSPISRGGRPSTPAGAGRKPCGASQSPQSASLNVRKTSRRAASFPCR